MKRRIAAGLSSLSWGYFAYSGYDLLHRVAQRQAPGYPNAEQWRYYVYFPLIMLAINAALLVLAKKMPTKLFVALWIIQLSIFVPFVVRYGGGV
jgi:hypothetical protein